MDSKRHKVFLKIVVNNLRRERITLSKYACGSNKGVRKYPELLPDRKNIRPIFSHDADRIMHSNAYTRYIDKTQVFYLFENDHITHRVLHIQLVSKIGRVIGRCLKLNEDLIEAISLGHDIGHVPYGHDGERILNKLCQDNEIGCFAHNAQSVRCLMELEQGGSGNGLNLSLQVLDGILAHNGEMISPRYKPNCEKNWERFEEEYRKCLEEVDYSKKVFPMTLEGCVVRIADVIAYIGRDIDDAIKLNVISGWDKIPSSITRTLGHSNAEIINTLVQDLLINSYDKPYLMFNRRVFKALCDLLEFNQVTIYSNSAIGTQASKIANMFSQLFEKYTQHLEIDDSESPVYEYLLNNLDDNCRRNTPHKRVVVDYIAGMTDDFFNNQYNDLFVPQSYGYSL